MSRSPQDRYYLWEYETGRTAKIRYRQSGPEESDKPALLFVHGYGGMLEHWNLNIPEFDHDRPVYALDLIGFGGSQKPRTRYRLELFAAQINAFIQYRQLEDVIIIGHSMGGASGLYYAHLNPETVSGLILANPSGLFGDTMDPMAKAFFGLIASPGIGEFMFAAFANQLGVSQSLLPTYYNQKKVDLRLINQFTRPLQDKGAVWSYLSPSRRPSDFTLEHLPRPCRYRNKAFLIWGAEDSALPAQKIIPEFQELLPQAGAYIIPKAAHCIHHDAHEAFNNRLRHILDNEMNV
ncbi:alpha/beta fold hydrolase [Prosthecochloris sp. N3]|uniref:Alpha/beta fold hydrolase n=1 Tax=Prosthecochloris ethylica TaxID=2743976 RepID=A0ABR9XU20_9CHLB|nr:MULTISPECIES: alpha/beta fold hydrolase [Prosthecochloris]MEC9487488.1 alpha/beta fold hydrolase [Prosthecochloris sp.]MBF0587031.1 alpha/beta fold hydrolase [Prosthecochloris ethylica]MBF0637373.1 alpha/beta fold hydrolase [Prosthecochloris ethylica]NUK48129.1 alpha/beta fold hydrolase [Prosthecochloris ethylica]RNA65297.1 alpha/beta fold hydrolase [Prosthecochloris sp. ZM_2]